ncbi:MAG: hypothetical protein IJ866_00395 [Alphaproteobacteria bacterium]|nr:hypothetical protein [Alphaproteobacteria bacterium]
MANIFQKIFLSPLEVKVIDSIKKSGVLHCIMRDDKYMFSVENYELDAPDMQMVSKHEWHHSQGDNYTITLNNKAYTNSQKIAKRIFERMQNKYYQQQM